MLTLIRYTPKFRAFPSFSRSFAGGPVEQSNGSKSAELDDLKESIEGNKNASIIPSLVNEISAEHSLTKKATRQIIDSIFLTITESLIHGKDVKIPSFGKFSRVIRSERKVRNISDGKMIVIPSKAAVKFSAFNVLKKSVATPQPKSTE